MLIKESIRGSYANVMRVVSTEAATTAHASNACFKDFQLVEIPDVMANIKATVGAALMKRWFAASPFTLPASWITGAVDFRFLPRQHIDTSIVKMSWITGFVRTQKALTALEVHRANTPAAARELKRCLVRSGLLSTKKVAIGTASDAITLHETTHLNMISVAFANSTDPLDCALGSFTLHMAVSGTIQPLVKSKNGLSHEVEVTALKFYIRDNYDFTTDDEPLGHWGRDGATALYSSGKVFVENKSFRDWRNQHQRGGDFVVFSDVMTKSLVKPLTILI